MKDYRANGGLRRGTAVLLAACFLLGSSITSLAAGDGVTDAYKDLADSTSVWDTYGETGMGGTDVPDDETREVLSKVWDIDPEKVTIFDDGIETYGLVKQISWVVPPGETYMATGNKFEKGDKAGITVLGTPHEVEYRFGLKDPKAIMWYVEGSGLTMQEFVIAIKGRHYFFVSNLSETEDLEVEATIYREEN